MKHSIRHISLVAALCAILLPPVVATAQQLPLSDGATASVLTCGAGNEFYTTFGHSAIRICDTAQGLDVVYNYGTFDFDTPNFYLKFARGMLDYCLSRQSMDGFMAVYDYERRAVWEQRLNLTPQEVANLYVMLEQNYLPEYRYYRYDFFRDNCATRVRDMVLAAPSHRNVQFDWRRTGEKKSYRDLVHMDTRGTLEWWQMGVDLLLGLPADHTCNTDEWMFHPVWMMNIFEDSRIVSAREGNEVPLVSESRQLLSDTRTPLRRSFSPTLVFAIVLAVAVLLSLKFRKKKSVLMDVLDRVLFVLAGIVGLFLVFMWVGTDHYCTAWNPNILWASPLLILIAIRMVRSPRWALWLQMACFATVAVWALVCGVSTAILLLDITLAIRVAALLVRKRRTDMYR